MTIPATPMPSAVPDTGSQSRAKALADIKALVDLVAAECMSVDTDSDPDEDSVGWSDGESLPMTFGHIRRAIQGLACISAPHVETSEVDLVAYIKRQWAWSRETFGPALRTGGVIDHIRKELREIEAEPHDLSEWVDVIILAMDGFWRHGGKPEELLPRMQAKQDKNFARTWPDWQTLSEDTAIEHDRSEDIDAALASHPVDADRLPADVVALVIAARAIAFEDPTPEAIKALDTASEAFASRVPWDDEPEPVDADRRDGGAE